MMRKISVVGESIQTWTRPSLIAALEVRSLERMLAIDFVFILSEMMHS